MWKLVDGKWICTACGFVSPSTDLSKAPPDGTCFMCSIRSKGWIKNKQKQAAR